MHLQIFYVVDGQRVFCESHG